MMTKIQLCNYILVAYIKKSNFMPLSPSPETKNESIFIENDELES